MTNFSLFPTQLGVCGIAWRGNAIVATQLPEASAAATTARLAERMRAAESEPPPSVTQVIASITALLAGAREDLSGIHCDFSELDLLSRRVYDLTRSIRVGETSTYGAIASQLGNKRLAQHVGRVLGRNPLPIIVPCHRVVGANGTLTGFSAFGGIDTKRKMLAIEGVRLGEQPSLFDDIP